MQPINLDAQKLISSYGDENRSGRNSSRRKRQTEMDPEDANSLELLVLFIIIGLQILYIVLWFAMESEKTRAIR